ncbi:hypothetical protein [Cryptosporangium aurantiacum]|uniref:Uncharacterized protein n=1 Tax=Cryptosporangium aurantiacum TaxID=134849 RepID=A0A1M7QTY3_9ACTN|nr:hypothetical protein [Cryptosporangium aurantiacum]SHN35311.1 hypothetical protein SAMN05443668_105380 [Cryptosporangium aurantiacum]
MTTDLRHGLLQRPGTLLLFVLLADTYAYFVSDAGSSAVGLLVYLLQAFLLYRVWRGANLVPVMLLLVIAGYEAYCVKQVVDAGIGGDHRTWVLAHVFAIMVTVAVLFSAPVRQRRAPLRGVRRIGSE